MQLSKTHLIKSLRDFLSGIIPDRHKKIPAFTGKTPSIETTMIYRYI